MCVSVERIYVHEQVYDRFVDAVVRDVDALKVGSGDGFNYGSLIDQNQLELMKRHVDDAKAKGARALSGGKRMPGNGVFYPPTVLVDVDHSMACMTEETFGPTLPIMTVSNESEAIRLANDSPYGPSASVFSGDLQRAKEVAVQLDCGAVNINDAVSNLSCTSAPMGGWKSSGIGARFGGAEGLRRFSRVETVVEPKIKFGAGANYYTASPRAQARMNKQTTWMALRRPRPGRTRTLGLVCAVRADGPVVARHDDRTGGYRAGGVGTAQCRRRRRLCGTGTVGCP
jgi:delta 1-pyrroline-5-carboxylate dehydrogenase